MTLEDFFTLNEMKNGVSTLPRVEELISAMERQKDCVVKNAGDTTRQWSTVAHTLAATENKDCLRRFVELNGLFFLNQWFQEALKCGNDGSSSTMEEVIHSLLGSLERLPVDKKNLTAYGIWATAEQLLAQRNPSIKERVRNLLDKWNSGMVNDVGQDMENGGTCQDNQHKPSADANTIEDGHLLHPLDISSCNLGHEERNCRVDSAGAESHLSNFTKISDSPQLDITNDVKISTPNLTMPTESQNSANANEAEISSPHSCHVSNSCQDNFSVTKESVPAVGMASADLCSSSVVWGKAADKQSEVSKLKDVDSVKEMEVDVVVNMTEVDQRKSSQKENCNAPTSSGVSAPLSAQKMESTISCNFYPRESKCCVSKASEPQPTNKGTDCRLPKYFSTTKELNSVAYVAMGSQDLPSSMCELSKIDGSENSFQRKEAVESDSGINEHCNEAKLKVSEGVNLVIPSSSSKKVSMKVTGEMDRRSEMEFECGEIDALEVARQVALEVEREVVDYREPFCSSSPEIDSGERVETCSPELVEGKQDRPTIEELNQNESPTGKDLSDSSSSLKDDNSEILAQSGIDTERNEQDIKPELTTVAQEVDFKIGKNVWDFDLNEDVCTEDDHPINSTLNSQVNLSAPKAVVAASKGAPELPVSPSCFEGELGWRGSAATSAFRPAYPRRTPDAEMNLGPKNRTSLSEIDLNVAESEDNVAVDLASVKEVPHLSGFPSGESSMEISSRRVERLKLDLNRLGDEDMSPHPSSFWNLHHQNGDQSLSAASSSRQLSMKDFDLNDNPSLFDIGGSHNPNKPSFKASGMSGSVELDDPVVTIMGSRMAAEKKDYGNQTQQSYLGNVLSLEPAVSARQMLPYAHMPPPAYRYTGLGTGPALPYPPALYGPNSVPYMVDSRGAPVVPQIIGSAGLSGAPSATPPFLTSVHGTPRSSKGTGSSQSGVDLNSAMTLMDSGNREPGGFRQLVVQGHDGLTEEQTRSAAQLASSGMTLKRKEPDCGRDPCTLGYKQVTSWR
ncbi:uncharacterized protein [Elaeis guineensis]|uniref:Uncharacterized protein LOC105044053 n=1 Tax=Elaeis guineensis var. tenera TaxID=51953 RepID=A0A6I9R3Y2_ELAGV|nr:uncharacterized protein LOC105044053 [Elaeis guineensis]XP_010920136.1 uncharacterized protein LOC105044053 [Elaeis guineensis]XP_010920137.1 uncharacterized protein LOC105044053 [Elaeis guineensis]XP_010920138.1 uncharacterized protein LOC105044053 [Elaeis guineensis]XP_019705731.1 uncharacterized protein LOC105044053 [Elaeis guineensis]XP_029120066.1 uncharacterized protein LOC105044053 [Elaeis guineensis]